MLDWVNLEFKLSRGMKRNTQLRLEFEGYLAEKRDFFVPQTGREEVLAELVSLLNHYGSDMPVATLKSMLATGGRAVSLN